MKNSLTQVAALSAVLAVLDTYEGDYILTDGLQVDKKELAVKIASMIDTLNKKRTTPTKADLEKASATEELTTAIYDTLITLNKPSSISDIQAANVALAGYSTSKMSAMLKKLIDAGRVIRTVEKKKAMFTAVPVK